MAEKKKEPSLEEKKEEKQDMRDDGKSEDTPSVNRLNAFLEQLNDWGITAPVMRYGTHIITIILIIIVVVTLSNFYLKNVKESSDQDLQATAMAIAAPTLNAVSGISAEEAALGITFPPFRQAQESPQTGISRKAEPETVIPSRPRVDVITYEVQQGDNLFSIADQYGIQPETILWGNYTVLQDNPRLLSVGQTLNILPTNGTYHRYSQGEGLKSIADFFGVDVQAIVDWPGNHLDPYEVDVNNPNIEDGTWLIVPGGQRELQDWGPPAITRDNPAVASYYGEGSCGEVYQGAIGNGTFIWPTGTVWISGYDYDANIHPAIDIGGTVGEAIYATDSGVVVYAGWSNYGYGYLIVLDHGTGWQSAYAHLSGIAVYCGQSVYQGDVIGALGSTGNSSGPHLHFELNSAIYGKVNPHDYLILP